MRYICVSIVAINKLLTQMVRITYGVTESAVRPMNTYCRLMSLHVQSHNTFYMHIWLCIGILHYQQCFTSSLHPLKCLTQTMKLHVSFYPIIRQLSVSQQISRHLQYMVYTIGTRVLLIIICSIFYFSTTCDPYTTMIMWPHGHH